MENVVSRIPKDFVQKATDFFWRERKNSPSGIGADRIINMLIKFNDECADVLYLSDKRIKYRGRVYVLEAPKGGGEKR